LSISAFACFYDCLLATGAGMTGVIVIGVATGADCSWTHQR